MTVAPPRAAPAASDSPPRLDERPPTGAAGLPVPAFVRVRVTGEGGPRVVTLPLDEYVLGVVRAEMSQGALRNASALRGLEVQAIVSRTYALANLGRHAAEGFNLCDSTHCQVYRREAAGEAATDLAARAVRATGDQVVTYQGRIIQALFHANCGGYTASAGSVWGGSDAPYLRPVPDWYCSRKAASDWTFSVDGGALLRVLNADPRTEVGSRLSRIGIAERDASGRAIVVSLTGAGRATIRAEAFRAIMRQAFGERSIRSTWFSVVHEQGRFVFTGVGLGHGVGLCQAGALQRALAGQSPTDIIAHYYAGTRVQSASTAALAAFPAFRQLGAPPL